MNARPLMKINGRKASHKFFKDPVSGRKGFLSDTFFDLSSDSFRSVRINQTHLRLPALYRKQSNSLFTDNIYSRSDKRATSVKYKITASESIERDFLSYHNSLQGIESETLCGTHDRPAACDTSMCGTHDRPAACGTSMCGTHDRSATCGTSLCDAGEKFSGKLLHALSIKNEE
jgi:hypothetical protein